MLLSSLMVRKKESPQKAAIREMMRSYLKENDICIKNGVDVNAVMILSLHKTWNSLAFKKYRK